MIPFISKTTKIPSAKNCTTHKPSERNILIITSCVQNKPSCGFPGIKRFYVKWSRHTISSFYTELYYVVMHTRRCVMKQCSNRFYQRSESQAIHPHNVIIIFILIFVYLLLVFVSCTHTWIIMLILNLKLRA